MLLWLYDLPLWLFATLVVGGTTAASLGGLALVHRARHRRRLRHQQSGRGERRARAGIDAVGWYFSGVLTLYGITLGLVTVATWGTYTGVGDITSAEAAALTTLYRDADGYPEPTRSTVRRQVCDYTRHVVEVAWPAQRLGRLNADGDARITALQQVLVRFAPRTLGEQAIHAEALRQFNAVVEHRRRRAESVSTSIPGVLWAVVLCGAALVVALSYTFPVARFGDHAWLTGVVTATMALLIFVIATLDHPYRGAVSVTPEAYRLVLTHVMMEDLTPAARAAAIGGTP